MRVLFLSNYYPPFEVGGYEQLCRDVALCLTTRGHEIAVLTSDHGVERRGQDTSEPGIYRVLRIQPDPRAHLGPAAQSFLTRRQAEARNRHAYRTVAQHFRPDVVFVWNLEGLPHELALDAEASPGAAVAYWLAGHSPAEPDSFWRYWTRPPGRRVLLRGPKDLLRRVALAQMRREGKPVRPQMCHVAVVSEYMLRQGLAENVVPAGAEVIHNGVETDRFYRPVPRPDNSAPVNLLLAGRIAPDKGVHVAIEAVGWLARERPQRNFRLLIAGRGPRDYLGRLQQLAAAYGLEHEVSLVGWLPREHMPQLMHRCHILLLPTVHEEPFARVLLEGMAAGLAVVGTLTGGTGELLQQGHNGLVCTAQDSRELARQIGCLLDDPCLRHRLASQGQDTVMRHYSLQTMVERVEVLLERAVAGRNV